MGAAMGKRGGGGSIFDHLPGSSLHIVILGLDSAGKTTALYRLKFDQYVDTVPTIGFNCEKVKVKTGQLKGHTFVVWDIGGQDKLRPLWKSYTRCTDGIIFVVDSVDLERIEEAKMELLKTIKQQENQGTPILVYANKQDLPGAKDTNEIAKILGLSDLSPNQYFIQPACAITGEGLECGLEKLHQLITNRKKMAKSGSASSKKFMSSTASSTGKKMGHMASSKSVTSTAPSATSSSSSGNNTIPTSSSASSRGSS